MNEKGMRAHARWGQEVTIPQLERYELFLSSGSAVCILCYVLACHRGKHAAGVLRKITYVSDWPQNEARHGSGHPWDRSRPE